MSLYCEIETEFRDERALVEALESMGLKGRVETYAHAVPLEGYEGAARSQKANLIVRRQHVGRAANDLGFAREKDGRFRLIVSEYDRAHGYGEAWLRGLRRSYAEKLITREYAMKRMRLASREQTADGRIILRFAR